MLGRRSHVRISLESGAEGVLSLPRDVSVHIGHDGQIVALSRDGAAIGERVRVLLAEDKIDVFAEVVESKPVISDGAVRHRLVLRCCEGLPASLRRPGRRAR